MSDMLKRIIAVRARWAALIQLAFLEANSRSRRRFSGVARVQRVGSTIALWGIGPMFILVPLDALGLGRGVLWWAIAALPLLWGLSLLGFLFSASAVALYRAARLRLAMDRAGLRRYPRYPRPAIERFPR